ncbi:hypothetical protein [Maribacter sp.]|uniref:hypothetical protein n=1 Tax=Maribacter sp. TaxID=1897614 RepID=UPI0025BC85D3|nr:hypothetical protein [Maribacter sp.]
MKNMLVFILPFLLGITSNESNELANLMHSQMEQGKRVIAIGETHQHKSFHLLLEKTLKTKQTQEDIDIIIVEFGNSFYQEELDRYINGENISIDTIRKVWRNTAISPNTVWDSPVYERFFKTIREINKSLLPKEKYRVVAGGKSIDWTIIKTTEDYEPYKTSGSKHIYEIVKKEVFVKNKKALLIAGGFHLSKVSTGFSRNGRVFRDETIGSLLELNYPGSTFFINSYSKLASLGITEIKNRKIGSLILTSEIWLRDIEANKASIPAYGNSKLKDIADAVFYWGSKEHWVYERPLKAIYQDQVYWEELNRRSLIRRNKKMDESLRN